jgi:signal transduction histidine kinase
MSYIIAIKSKLGSAATILFALIVLLSALIGFYIVSQNIKTESAFYKIEHEIVEGMLLLNNASRALWELRFDLPNYVTEGQKNRIKIRANFNKWKSKVDKNILEFSKIKQNKVEAELLNKFYTNYNLYLKFRPHYFELVDLGKIEEANKYRLETTKIFAGNTVEALDSLIEHQHDKADAETDRITDQVTYSRNSLIIYFLIQTTLCIGLYKAFKKSESKLEYSLLNKAHSSKMNSLGIMSSGIAHEINNPLSIIQGYTTKLVKSHLDGSATQENNVLALNKIKNSVERIDKIVKGMRSISRDAEKDELVQTPINSIIETINVLSSERFRNSDIAFTIGNIPNAIINCRSSQIEQVLINLLNNSYDAIIHQDQKWIKLDFKITHDTLSIYIIDSGNGIDIEIAQKMMMPFFTTKEIGKGTGIGLDISKQIMNDHGGKIWYNKNNLNTCFVLEFPLHAENQKNINKKIA